MVTDAALIGQEMVRLKLYSWESAMQSTIRHRACAALCVAGILFAWTRCPAGLGTTTGREWHRWTEDKYSVVVARVSEVAEINLKEGGTHRAVLEPLATLAGGLDPSEHPTLNVTLYAGGFGTSIRKAPSKGTTILAVLQGDDFIVSDICTFMPGRSAVAVAVVDGPGDPKVAETLRKLQDARAHPNPDPYAHGPATKPTTRPVP